MKTSILKLYAIPILLLSCFLPVKAQDSIAVDVPADTFLVDSVDVDETLPWDFQLRQRLDALIRNKLFETTQVAVMVWDLTADSCLYRYHERQRMRPASTMKIFTAVAALDRLGDNYQFTTQLRYSGQITERTDTVVLSPFSDTEQISVQPDRQIVNVHRSLHGNLYLVGGMDPLFSDADLQSFVRAVKSLRVDTIYGQIYSDRSFKEKAKWGEGWCWDDDNPSLSPLLLNRYDSMASNLYSELRSSGIYIYGGSPECETPENTTLLATSRHGIAEVMRPMMKLSDNQYAECMFYQLAHAEGGKWAGVKAGRTYIDQLIARTGTEQKLIHVADGSGLSLYNYATAEAETALLRYAYRDSRIIRTLESTLPVAGVDGTLKSRMRGNAATGNVKAKTGTVTGISSLCGYCTASNGHRLCFAILNQGIPSVRLGREFQDQFCIALCQ